MKGLNVLKEIRPDEQTLLFTTFFVFLFSLCPTVYVGDSSLFQVASFSLGSAHPPGYPLYILLGKFLTFLPFGNVAFKVNLVSAVFGALTCLMVFKTSMELTGNRYASWASSLICGISPLFFQQSVKAEVFTLNSFLAMVVFYLGVKLLSGGNFLKGSLLGFFIIGLGMANHHTIGFMGLIFLFPVFIRWKNMSGRWVIMAVLFFAVGFSANLLLYLRTIAIVHSGGLIMYSFVGSWHDFLKVLLREAYKGASTPATVAEVFSFGTSWYYGLKNSLVYVALSSARPVFPFLLLGVAYLSKKKKILFYFIFSLIVWYAVLGKLIWASPGQTNEKIQVISRYFFPSIPILYCLASVGFSGFINLFKRTSSKILPAFISYGVVAFPFALLPYSINLASLNNNDLAYYYGRDMLTVLPLKSLFMNYSDNAMFTTFYMRSVERLREDILVMNTSGEKDIYGLESSPAWKYAVLYPDFYGAPRSTLSQINAEFTLKGKLFVNDPSALTRAVSIAYSWHPFIFSSALYPKNMPADQFKENTRTRFKSGYEKTNYERVLQLPPTNDILAEEILAEYSFNTLLYADLIKREGRGEEENELYKRVFLIGYLEKVSWPYINFLLEDGRKKEAFEFLEVLKSPRGGYGDLAKLLEQKAISVTREKGNQ
jgi:hypothetical protein